jgi:hypothetical protein
MVDLGEVGTGAPLLRRLPGGRPITERPVMISASTCALRAAVALRKAEDAQSSEAAMALVAVADAWTRLVGTMALHDVVLNGNSPEMSDAEHLGPLERVDTHRL